MCLSNQPLLILEIHCGFVDCCKLENLRKAKLNTTCFLTESKGPWVDSWFDVTSYLACMFATTFLGPLPWLLRWGGSRNSHLQKRGKTGNELLVFSETNNRKVSCVFNAWLMLLRKEGKHRFQFPHYPFEKSCQLLIFQMIRFRKTLNNNRDLTQQVGWKFWVFQSSRLLTSGFRYSSGLLRVLILAGSENLVQVIVM